MNTQSMNVVPMAEPARLKETHEAYRPLIQTWVLRILVDLDACRQVDDNPFTVSADTLGNFLGLEPGPGEDMEDTFTSFNLNARLRELEKNPRRESCVLTVNLHHFSKVFGLSRAEAAILEFILLAHRHDDLSQTCALLGDSLTLGEVIHALAVIVQQPEDEVAAALGSRSHLLASGFMRIDEKVSGLLNRVQVLMALMDALSLPEDGEGGLGMLHGAVEPAPSPELAPDDLMDYHDDYQLIRRYLTGVFQGRREGGNVLIYGPPGVGKTQLVRTLCADMDAQLYESVVQDANGEPLSPGERLVTFNLGRRLLAERPRAVLAFDGFDDLMGFGSRQSRFPRRRDRVPTGGSFDAQVESSTLTAFWLAEEVGSVDPRHLGAFDIVVEMRPMGPRSRRRLLEEACRQAGLKGGTWVQKAAECPHLNPRLIRSVVAVMSCTAQADSQSEAHIFEQLANGKLAAMGLAEINLRPRTAEIPYKVDYLNADTDLKALVEGLRRNQEGRLLCYGPPGTGKTAFARHLAEELNLPLLQFRASDILGSFVGETERQLAAAFKQAKAQGAIMLLDEIDSLLRSRAGAHHSWEVTQVNELLVQMENFPGILVACTNFDDLLDPAASRRFDLKIRLGYLTPPTAWSLFTTAMTERLPTLDKQKGDMQVRLTAMNNLTVGDFARIIRRLAMSILPIDAENVIDELSKSNQERTSATDRSIGFHAQF